MTIRFDIAAHPPQLAYFFVEVCEENSRIRKAAQDLIGDVKRRYPGQPLYCPYMRKLEFAIRDKSNG